MLHQLRIYEIFESNKAAFHERFRDHAAPIMARYGFDLVAMWEGALDGRLEFVYVLAWPDADTMKAAWAAFLADEEWREVKRATAARHGDLFGEIEDRVLVEVPYSSGLSARRAAPGPA
jgi:NIPSNAP